MKAKTGKRKRQSPKRRKSRNALVPITLEPNKPLSSTRRVVVKIREADKRFVGKGAEKP